MRLFLPAAVLNATVAAFPNNWRIVEFAPGNTKILPEAGKLDLIKEGIKSIDVSGWPGPPKKLDCHQVRHPTQVAQNESVTCLIQQLDIAKMRPNLETFTNFHNRHYESETGRQSSEWLLRQARSYVPLGSLATVSLFHHASQKSSIIATIPGKSPKTIVLGAHCDSINTSGDADEWWNARAPGADDNGSDSITILEVFRTLLTNRTIANGSAPHTIEFHWYAKEELGLLGSGHIFSTYAAEGRDIAAMLNQEMTGYTAGYTSHNMTPKFGIVTDGTSAPLTEFMRLIIDAYTHTEVVDTRCGYACSDHGSVTRAGYPSAFVFEGEMRGVNDYPFIHSADDTIENIDFEHVLEHARLVVGFVVELAFAEL
ncbi:Zn-dependent exopeptidase [Decorospora gaudefroyi]|uniref:Peptide hydrolase n=1 Tax=Decorospora gaudefroyi TaxID=184978 RepID=A0A6A5KBU0_9PLEO|nr:Zn-dependent exopeptidase [Decorospora gaudefroyi]